MALAKIKIRWWVYLLRCADRSLYCGITLDLKRRINEHNASNKGARYTRGRRPVQLAWSEAQRSHSLALKRELQIKRLTRSGKERLIERKKNPARLIQRAGRSKLKPA